MTFRIYYIQFTSLETLRNALKYLFSNQDDIINNITKMNITKTIDIINDKVSYETALNNIAIELYDDDFVRCVDILKQINDKTIILHVTNNSEYEQLCKIDDRYNQIEICYEKFYYILCDKIYYINEDEYNIFFSKYNVVNIKQYIRNLKLNTFL